MDGWKKSEVKRGVQVHLVALRVARAVRLFTLHFVSTLSTILYVWIIIRIDCMYRQQIIPTLLGIRTFTI